MQLRTTGHAYLRYRDAPSVVATASPARLDDPPDIPGRHPVTGTVDDHDAPGDERDDENEARTRETGDQTEAPEEFEHDADDRGDRDER